MPINVFGNSNSNDNGNKFDASIFVQKSYLRSNYIKANIEEDIDLKNQHRVNNLTDVISIREPASKKFVDNLFNDSSIPKNTALENLNNGSITNATFFQVNQWPQTDSHLTAKLYIGVAISNNVDESSLLRLHLDENLKLDEQDSINLSSSLTSPKTIIEIPTESYIDSLHQENEQSRRDSCIDFCDESSDLVKYNQDNDLNGIKLTNLNSVTVNRNPNSDKELVNKKYLHDEFDENTIVRLNQTLQNYLKISAGKNTYNLTKYNTIQITDTTTINAGSNDANLIQKWNIKCNDIN